MSNDWSCLKGVKILDLSGLHPGPYASMLLSDFGAEVIKIEDPRGGDHLRAFSKEIFQMLNRNKKSIALNLKYHEGTEIFKKLVSQADAVIEGFRPGFMERLGLGYQTLKEVNPRIVFCSISGFGQEGPYVHRAAHDLNYLALSGYFAVPSQIEDKTARPKIRLADFAGAMFAALSLTVAIMSARDSGEGQHLDISIHDAISSWVAPLALTMHHNNWGADLGKMPHIMPDNDLFETKDRKFLSLGILENKFWIALRDLLKTEYPDIANPDYDRRAGRMDHKKAVYQLLADIFKTKTLAQWEKLLGQKDLPWAPVYDLESFLNDPHLKSRQMIKEIVDERSRQVFKQPAYPVKFSKGLDDVRDVPPELGEQTEEILRELGYTHRERSTLRKKKII